MKNKKNTIMGLAIGIITLIVIIIIIIILNSGDKLPIAGKEWINSNNDYTETILFSNKGDFTYNNSLANIGNNYESCTKYKYNKKNKTIKLTCSDKVKEKEIKLIDYTEDSVTLQFANEEKKFILIQE